MENLMNLYNKAIAEKKSLLLQKENCLKDLESKNAYKTSLISLHLQLEEKDQPQTSQFPIIVGNASTRMSILDLGRFATENIDMYHTPAYIFPIGYKAKRRYNKHPNCKRSDEKVFYILQMKENLEKEISCSDKRWTSWEEFKNEVGGDIKTVEEFFGLDNLAVMKLIESLGDVSIFKNYIPVVERDNKEKE